MTFSDISTELKNPLYYWLRVQWAWKLLGEFEEYRTLLKHSISIDWTGTDSLYVTRATCTSLNSNVFSSLNENIVTKDDLLEKLFKFSAEKVGDSDNDS